MAAHHPNGAVNPYFPPNPGPYPQSPQYQSYPSPNPGTTPTTTTMMPPPLPTSNGEKYFPPPPPKMGQPYVPASSSSASLPPPPAAAAAPPPVPSGYPPLLQNGQPAPPPPTGRVYPQMQYNNAAAGAPPPHPTQSYNQSNHNQHQNHPPASYYNPAVGTSSQPPMPPLTANSMSPQRLVQPPLPPTSAAAVQPSYQPPSRPGSQQQQPPPPPAAGLPQMTQNFGNLNVNVQEQPNSTINLLQQRRVLPKRPVEPPTPKLSKDYQKNNANPDVFRCTLTHVPQTQALLNKSRLPLGILLHPFKDMDDLVVLQPNTIVRCRSCRTYINPFVSFVDNRRWRCNLCFRTNDLPEEFNICPATKTYGSPNRRPEVNNATIEYIAPSEYMLRPPQPAVYLFLFDVSYAAMESGYLRMVTEVLLDKLEQLPGDQRTQIGFVTYNSAVHFYNLAEGLSRPQMLVISDLDEIFLPTPDSLLVNLKDSMGLIADLLQNLPDMFAVNGGEKGSPANNTDSQSALGAALQAAHKMLGPTGGRVTVFQCVLPQKGPGALESREDPNQRSSKEVQHLNPATDFYKSLSLEFSAQQIAVDLFILAGQYADVASLSCVSKFSGGEVKLYPAYHAERNPAEAERLELDLDRYLTRKIGFEAVMRVRCTRGLAIHTFHGNFFVRSTDLLALPNVNPDASYGMQISIDDDLTSQSVVCFQAALLYTSQAGERKIRVHTLCLPITTSLSDVFVGADPQAITGLVSRMAVDKSLQSSLGDARDAFTNVCVDYLSAFANTLSASQKSNGLHTYSSLKLLPLYMLALMKSPAFRIGTPTRLDQRVFDMGNLKTLPLDFLMVSVHPTLYPVHDLDQFEVESPPEKKEGEEEEEEEEEDPVPEPPDPPILPLSAEHIDRHGMYLMDAGTALYLWVGRAISDALCQQIFNVEQYGQIPDGLLALPELENPTSARLNFFIDFLRSLRPFHATLQVIREDGRQRQTFLQYLIEDRTESTLSYYEYLQFLQKGVK